MWIPDIKNRHSSWEINTVHWFQDADISSSFFLLQGRGGGGVKTEVEMEVGVEVEVKMMSEEKAKAEVEVAKNI